VSLTLADENLPPNAAAYLEATCAGSNIVQRFDLGTIENPNLVDRELTEVEGENVFFSLKIVDTSQWFGRLLGIAQNIRPERSSEDSTAGRRGILPIEPAELQQQLWRLEFRDHDVFLLVNKDVPDLRDRVRSDPLFYAAVYPELVRQILFRALEQDSEIVEDEERWPAMWLRFGKNLHPEHEPPPLEGDNDEEREEWVEEVVNAFCESHLLKNKYLAAVPANGGDA
jgi:hypothetical protein